MGFYLFNKYSMIIYHCVLGTIQKRSAPMEKMESCKWLISYSYMNCVEYKVKGIE